MNLIYDISRMGFLSFSLYRVDILKINQVILWHAQTKEGEVSFSTGSFLFLFVYNVK
jgi:hypothetical protein